MMKNRSLFLVWGTPDQGPRSIALAKKLGIEIHFIRTRFPRGALYALIRYPIQAVKTMWLFARKRPGTIFVQSPPPLAVICAWFYCAITKAEYVVDAHSTAFSNLRWVASPLWMKKFLSRRAVYTIVTNEHWQELVREWGGEAIILRDIPTTFPGEGNYPLDGKFNVVYINTFSEDEPLEDFVEAACELPDVDFYVTGKIRPKDSAFVSRASPNIHFTDFLPEASYYSLLRSADAVLCLTTRDHTMQRGACEALSLGKPIITSDWMVLRNYFHKGTVYVDNSIQGIRAGVTQMKDRHHWYQAGIEALRIDQENEWKENARPLIKLIERHFDSL